MTAPRLTCSLTWTLRGMSAAEGYAAARAMGFTAIEHSFPYGNSAEETARLLKACGLEMSMMYSPCNYAGGEKGYACEPGREAEFALGIAEALRYAETVGCRILGILVGEIPEGVDRRVCDDVLAHNLGVAADAAKAAGVMISLEPITSARIPRFALHTLDQGAAMLDRVGSDAMGLCYDTFHVAMEKGSYIEAYDAHLPRINYVQIATSPGRTGPGTGELDLLHFVDHALNKGWDGWLSCEYIVPPEGRDTALAWATPYLEQGRLRV